MSANIRILKGMAEDLAALSRQYPILKQVHEKLVHAIVTVEEKKKKLDSKKGPFTFSTQDLENFVVQNIRKPIWESYETAKRDLDKPVRLFIEKIKQKIKDRYEGVNSCAKPETVTDWTLDALAGLEQEKEAVKNAWLRPQAFPALFTQKPKGILFYGPPGTGKTVLAKAMSNALPGVAFFPVDSSQLKSRWLGDTEKLIAAKFDCASDIIESDPTKYQSAIVFIDEIDSIAAKREKSEAGAASTQALLVAMDGFFSSPNVAVLGATNTPWALDGGVLRRFDERIFLDLPTLAARIGIILDSIVKVFAPPWATGKREHTWLSKVPRRGDTYKTYEEVYGAMLNPRNYGGVSDETWGLFSLSNDKDEQRTRSQASGPEKVIWGAANTKDVILEVARLMGPKDSEKEKMWGRSHSELEFYAKAVSRFGYNASDIAKTIKKAAQISASKTLMEPNVYGAYWLKVTDSMYPSTLDVGDRKYYYAVYPKERDEAQHKTWQEAKEEGNAKYLVNFTLSLEDIQEAMKLIGSSVIEEEYIQLLAFRKSG